MKYIGLDVHVKTTVWCCLDETGKITKRGKTPTTPAELSKLVEQFGDKEELLLAQDSGLATASKDTAHRSGKSSYPHAG